MSVCRYMDISSNFRDRVMFPNPFEFQVSYTNLSAPRDPKRISDAYAPAAPYNGDVMILFAPNFGNTMPLALSGQSVAGAYIGEYFDVIDSLGALISRHTVTDYNATTNTITVTPNFNLGIGIYFYYFRHKLPVES